MWRFTLLCSVLTLTVACGDGPGAPSVNTDGLFLSHEGDPPPPPLDGSGRVSFLQSDLSIEATEIATHQDCEPPTFPADITIRGDYFENQTHNSARIRFTPDPVLGMPDPGTGTGIIHERANPITTPLFDRQDASGTLVVMDINSQRHQIHLFNYDGAPLLLQGSAGGISEGLLEAVVTVCGQKIEYTGDITFAWCFGEC